MARSRRSRMQELQGLAASPGIAIGSAVSIESEELEVYRIPLPAGELDAEVARFRKAVEKVGRDLRRLRSRVDESLGEELGGIFGVHGLLLKDPSFTARIEERIRRESVNAEWAVHKVAEELARRMAELDDDYLREREGDFRSVSRYLLRALQGLQHHEISEIEGDVIVVADDLTPTDAVRLGRQRVVGFVLERGGRTSHTTIIARSLKIPIVAGVSGITDMVTDEDPVIVDGAAGAVILHPTRAVLARYGQRQAELRAEDKARRATRGLAARTRDGVDVGLMANVDLPEELDDARAVGAAGVGLYRSEFLYIETSPRLPTEEEHLAMYRRVVRAAAPHPAIIRTLDLGGRKLAQEVLETREDNPVLGLRGLRLSMARPAVFRAQLRAILRAAPEGNLWMMVPMVSTLEEVRRLRTFLDEVARELEEEGIEHSRDFALGIMIEVPAAAMIADKLAREVDFFALGTNDLIQYGLAVDRANEHVNELYQPLHPGILRLVRFVVDSAEQAGIEVILCGETAADPEVVPLMLGLGVRRLSLTPLALPEVKRRVREVAVSDMVEVAKRCEEFGTAEEVGECLRSALASSQEAEPMEGSR